MRVARTKGKIFHLRVTFTILDLWSYIVGAIFAIFLPSLKQLACAVEYHPKYSHFILTYREVARNSVAKLPSCQVGGAVWVLVFV